MNTDRIDNPDAVEVTGTFGKIMPRQAQEPAARAPMCHAAWFVGGTVPRCHWTDKVVSEYLHCGHPVVLTGGCPLISEPKDWSVERLVQLQGDKDANDWPVHHTPGHVRRVTRTYGEGLGEGGIRNMSLREFASLVAAELGRTGVLIVGSSLRRAWAA